MSAKPPEEADSEGSILKCELMSCAAPVHDVAEHPQRGEIPVCRHHFWKIQEIAGDEQ